MRHKNPKSGYAAPRDGSGYTPRQRLDAAKADIAEMEREKLRGDLVSRSEVEARDKADAEILRSDLASLAAQLSGPLSGKKFSMPQVREIAMKEIQKMVARWNDAGLTRDGDT